MGQIMLQVITSQHSKCLFPAFFDNEKWRSIRNNSFWGQNRHNVAHILANFSFCVSANLVFSSRGDSFIKLKMLRQVPNVHRSWSRPLSIPLYLFYRILWLSDFFFNPVLYLHGTNPSCPASTFLSLYFCFLVPQPLTAFPDYPPIEIIGVYQCLSLIYGLSL